MTSKEEHLTKIKEQLEEIEDAINQGFEKKPITLGFHCSACSVQFLELYLHLINKIPIGKIVKHDWFKRPHLGQKIDPMIERKLAVNFSKKEEIYSLMYSLEESRNRLVYGGYSKNEIQNLIENFNKLKELFWRLFSDENFKIES
jgi:hypothetical protein